MEKTCPVCKKNEIARSRRMCNTCAKKKKKESAREYQKWAYVKPCDEVLVKRPRKIRQYRSPITQEEQQSYDKQQAIRLGERVGVDINSPIGRRVTMGRL